MGQVGQLFGCDDVWWYQINQLVKWMDLDFLFDEKVLQGGYVDWVMGFNYVNSVQYVDVCDQCRFLCWGQFGLQLGFNCCYLWLLFVVFQQVQVFVGYCVGQWIVYKGGVVYKVIGFVIVNGFSNCLGGDGGGKGYGVVGQCFVQIQNVGGNFGVFISEQFVGVFKVGGNFIGDQQYFFLVVYFMYLFQLFWMVYLYVVCFLDDRFEDYCGDFMMMCGYQVGKWYYIYFVLFVVKVVLWCGGEQVIWQVVLLQVVY